MQDLKAMNIQDISEEEDSLLFRIYFNTMKRFSHKVLIYILLNILRCSVSVSIQYLFNIDLFAISVQKLIFVF